MRALALIALAACGAGAAPPAEPAPARDEPRRGGAIVVAIGAMTDADAGTSAAMRAAAADALAREPDFATGAAPARYAIDGAVVEHRVGRQGRGERLVCKVNLIISSHPDRAMLAVQSAQASVPVPPGGDGVAAARRDCAAAVVASLVGGDVVRYLRAR